MSLPNPLPNGRQRSKYWCGTWFKPTGITDGAFDATFDTKPSWNGLHYICGQQELCPDSGRIHWQLYLEFDTVRSLGYLRTLLQNAHWEKRFGTQQEAINYCKKLESRHSPPFEFGAPTLTNQGQRSDLSAIKTRIDQGETLLSIAQDHFGDFLRYHKGFITYQNLLFKIRSVPTELWIFSGASGSGKSFSAMEIAGPNSYWQMGDSRWWDGYDPRIHDTVVIDDFDWTKWPLPFLLRLADRTPLRVQVKGSSLEFSAKRLVITCVTSWENWWPGCAQEHDLAQVRRRITRHYECFGITSHVIRHI